MVLAAEKERERENGRKREEEIAKEEKIDKL